jgi:hypothetical protein
MNVLLSPQPPVFPHHHENPRLSPQRSGAFASLLNLCQALPTWAKKKKKHLAHTAAAALSCLPGTALSNANRLNSLASCQYVE